MPAGFFSAEADGNIIYLNATLAEWLDQDLAQVGSGGLKLSDVVAGEGAALLTNIAASPGDVKTELLDIDFKKPLFALVDRIAISPELHQRIVDTVETCYREAGEVLFQPASGGETLREGLRRLREGLE